MAPASQDFSAIIMAGGKGSRIGSGALPKCLLPLRGQQTLLTGLIDQLLSAGIDNIVVCCSPENFPLIRPVVESSQTNLNRPGLGAASCPGCRLGPLPALAEALAHAPASWHLLCLADVSFATPPFQPAIRHAHPPASFDGCLLTGTDQTAAAQTATGSVLCRDEEVRAVSYKHVDAPPNTAERHRNWSGSFLFRSTLVPDLNRHVAEYHQAPFEQWLQGLLDRGARCQWMDAGPFVNVNTPRDYQFLVEREASPS